MTEWTIPSPKQNQPIPNPIPPANKCFNVGESGRVLSILYKNNKI